MSSTERGRGGPYRCLVGEICAGQGTTRDFLPNETIGENLRRLMERTPDPLPERLVEALVRRLKASPDLAERFRDALGVSNRHAGSSRTIPGTSDLPLAIARARRGAVASRTGRRRATA